VEGEKKGIVRGGDGEAEKEAGRNGGNVAVTTYSNSSSIGAYLREGRKKIGADSGSEWSEGESEVSTATRAKVAVTRGAKASQGANESDSRVPGPQRKRMVPAIFMKEHQYLPSEEEALTLIYATKEAQEHIPCIKCKRKGARINVKDGNWKNGGSFKCMHGPCSAAIAGVNLNKWALSNWEAVKKAGLELNSDARKYRALIASR